MNSVLARGGARTRWCSQRYRLIEAALIWTGAGARRV